MDNNGTFKITGKGYDPREVDEAFDEMRKEISALKELNQTLYNLVKQYGDTIGKYDEKLRGLDINQNRIAEKAKDGYDEVTGGYKETGNRYEAAGGYEKTGSGYEEAGDSYKDSGAGYSTAALPTDHRSLTTDYEQSQTALPPKDSGVRLTREAVERYFGDLEKLLSEDAPSHN